MKNKVSVIIGRFQRPTIHPALDEFIEDKLAESQDVLILVGLSQIQGTIKNPMDFETRKFLLQETYPDATIGYIKDTREHEDWSANLDEQVARFARKSKTNIGDVNVYGGENTVKSTYTGKLKILPLPDQSYINESLNLDVPSIYKSTLEYRLAICSALKNKYPTAYSTVDVAIVKGDELLLARKPGETLLRFVGGFVNPRETSKEAAIRETKEETTLDVGNLRFVDEFVIDDHRYRWEEDSIKSILFIADYVSGVPIAKDDIEELCWKSFDEIGVFDIVPEHRPLMDAFLLT